ncbi:activated leukocyte cell adhesion molecule b isoform X1 [Hippocampus comes]|uniref:activated leukocyte cell adhesion molecule b isoform X1 n=1 Tax=Hippocampus comes TaxID=109280 RepID=UPI00094EF70E|nr:PREDICTED: CD166 antigen homolog A-like isoform X1 [Hippocampus comes]XP_019729861.1 PREDICTED: CD166 antigen homolog A-like isoform X1 [Hippocampus comes]XP_019729862.1 PREDICTED: CD166 antigen homolog A-like isoform X1 [Hippocampus comes]
MHLLSADCLGSLFLLLPTFFGQVSGLETVMGLYDQTLEIPCNKGAVKAEDALITKWKYDKGDGLSGDLLVRKKTESVSISTTDEYKGRINMAANSSLLLSALKLSDQRTFTCMVVVGLDIDEYPVNVVVYKAPEGLEISDKAQELAIGKLTKLATCIAKDANPAANITWLKNNKPLVDGGKGVSIRASVQVDPVSGLSSTSSTLEYSATKEDTDAQFSCSAQHNVGKELASSALTFTITYSTENIVLEVIAPEPLVEGDNVTLKCMADGNPAPTSFNFHVKGDVIPVKNMDTYTLTHVSRDDTGEYQCSLIDNPAMMASKDVTVNYLDIELSPTGSVVKAAGEALELSFQIDSSGQSKVSWTKDNVKLDKEPEFTELKYSDSGRYESDVKMGALSKKVFFDLVVEGAPVIKQLSKQRSEDGQHKVLICEAEGSPKPSVSWSINGTSLEESPFLNGKVTHKITVVPTINLTVSCTVSNEFGVDTWTIDVSSLFEEVRVDKRDESEDADQTKLVVGVVVGLFIATMLIGLAYGICQKKSKQGSWKTGEKENGSSDEERKLEEKVEENSQKAEV